jgi:hypothetical protein
MSTVRPFLSLASTGLGSLTRRISRETGALFLRSTLLGGVLIDSWPGSNGGAATIVTATNQAAAERQPNIPAFAMPIH